MFSLWIRNRCATGTCCSSHFAVLLSVLSWFLQMFFSNCGSSMISTHRLAFLRDLEKTWQVCCSNFLLSASPLLGSKLSRFLPNPGGTSRVVFAGSFGISGCCLHRYTSFFFFLDLQLREGRGEGRLELGLGLERAASHPSTVQVFWRLYAKEVGQDLSAMSIVQKVKRSEIEQLFPGG